MKKKYLVVFLVVIVGFILGSYFIYINMFPYVMPIDYPKLQEINESKIVYYDENDQIDIDVSIEEVMNYIKSSKPTRTQSFNEIPNKKPYYCIELKTTNQLYTYYIYERNSQLFVELPYNGVYKIDEEVKDLLS